MSGRVGSLTGLFWGVKQLMDGLIDNASPLGHCPVFPSTKGGTMRCTMSASDVFHRPCIWPTVSVYELIAVLLHPWRSDVLLGNSKLANIVLGRTIFTRGTFV